jgi:hypothetical protein
MNRRTNASVHFFGNSGLEEGGRLLRIAYFAPADSPGRLFMNGALGTDRFIDIHYKNS